jgi:RNA polymerase sigma-54 factor
MLSMSIRDLNDYIDSILASNPFLKKHLDKKNMQTYGSDSRIEDIEDKKVFDPRKFLLSQLATLNLDEKDLEIAEYLIYEMDENGYIKTDIEEISRDIFADLQRVEGVLGAIQSLDPPGIGARDIRECLLIQLRRSNSQNSLEYAIVENFLSDLAVNDIPKIAKSLGVDKKLVYDAAGKIRALNPRPASNLLGEASEAVIPDLTATIRDNKVRLGLNRESIPRLKLYNPYENKLDVIKDPEAQRFLKENMEAGRQLIDNIKRREETMCRVANYILNAQKDNLIEGRGEMKTLTARNVAEALNLHPSTVCRTLLNKYIEINNTVIPLKNLLSHGIKKENGDIVSVTNIKNRIKKLVNEESKTTPLHDAAIKIKLQEHGIYIKRRTVAKYRESLRILPYHLRKIKKT